MKLLMCEHCFIFKFMVISFITLNCHIFMTCRNVFTAGLFERIYRNCLSFDKGA